MKALRWLAPVACAAVLADVLATFLLAPDAALFRARLTARVFYYHVPAAWVAYLAFVVTAAASAHQLWRGGARSDALAAASAEVGVLFAAVALATGLVWSTQEFGGSYSAIEDPSVLSLAVVVLSYLAYLALRANVEERDRRRRLAAVFGILAVLGVPLSYLAIKASVHPDFSRPEESLDPLLRAFLYGSAAAFALLYAALAHVRCSLALAQERLDDLEAP